MNEYHLRSAVWEITMGCNMRCKHCGSICEEKLPDELSTEEALDLCEELSALKLDSITLSGGEPTTREDWHLIAKKLSEGGIKTSIITNGWLIDDEILEKAKEANLHTMTISMDGMRETHDFIRKRGSFDKDMECLKKIQDKGINTAVITTINKKNITELEDMYQIFSEIGVTLWQLQIAMPMGNFKKQMDLCLDPENLDDIIDFAYSKLNGKLIMAFADCIGYYNTKAIEIIKRYLNESWCWQGCGAGKHSIGILYNGDIIGCTSLRDFKLKEGNIRDRRLADIWEDAESFKWNRELTKEQLKGICKKCLYGNLCLGGCANSRLCMNGDIYSENKYCSYNVEISKIQNEIDKLSDEEEFDDEILQLIEEEQFQTAEIYLNKALKKNATVKNLQLYAYVNFELQNYEKSKEVNEKILAFDSQNSYAVKGIGLVFIKIGRIEEGIKYLYNAANLDKYKNADYYYDLCIVLKELGRKQELEDAFKEAGKCSNFDNMRDRFHEIFTE